MPTPGDTRPPPQGRRGRGVPTPGDTRPPYRQDRPAARVAVLAGVLLLGGYAVLDLLALADRGGGDRDHPADTTPPAAHRAIARPTPRRPPRTGPSPARHHAARRAGGTRLCAGTPCGRTRPRPRYLRGSSRCRWRALAGARPQLRQTAQNRTLSDPACTPLPRPRRVTDTPPDTAAGSRTAPPGPAVTGRDAPCRRRTRTGFLHHS